jgi:hypothetical protein
MSKIDELKAFATATPLDGLEIETILSIDSETEIDEAMHGLDRTFQSTPALKAVLLQIQNERIGYLNRQDFCSFQSDIKADFGHAQGAALPGTAAYTLTEFKCPVKDCPEPSILMIHYRQTLCRLHPNAILQRVGR